MTVRASVFAALTMPLRPIDEPAQAAFCQLCPGVPGTAVAVLRPIAGTTQLTSPASVDALGAFGSGRRIGCTSLSLPVCAAPPGGNVLASASAKARSPGV